MLITHRWISIQISDEESELDIQFELVKKLENIWVRCANNCTFIIYKNVDESAFDYWKTEKIKKQTSKKLFIDIFAVKKDKACIIEMKKRSKHTKREGKYIQLKKCVQRNNWIFFVKYIEYLTNKKTCVTILALSLKTKYARILNHRSRVLRLPETMKRLLDSIGHIRMKVLFSPRKAHNTKEISRNRVRHKLSLLLYVLRLKMDDTSAQGHNLRTSGKSMNRAGICDLSQSPRRLR